MAGSMTRDEVINAIGAIAQERDLLREVVDWLLANPGKIFNYTWMEDAPGEYHTASGVPDGLESVFVDSGERQRVTIMKAKGK